MLSLSSLVMMPVRLYPGAGNFQVYMRSLCSFVGSIGGQQDTHMWECDPLGRVSELPEKQNGQMCSIWSKRLRLLQVSLFPPVSYSIITLSHVGPMPGVSVLGRYYKEELRKMSLPEHCFLFTNLNFSEHLVELLISNLSLKCDLRWYLIFLGNFEVITEDFLLLVLVAEKLLSLVFIWFSYKGNLEMCSYDQKWKPQDKGKLSLSFFFSQPTRI